MATAIHSAATYPQCRPRARTLHVSARACLALVPIIAGSIPGSVALAEGPLFNAPYLIFDSACTPNVVVSGDFDADGNPDLIVAGDRSCASLLRGRGDGTFGAPSSRHIELALCLAAADLDRNGTLDLVAGGGWVSVARGDGSGGFASPELYSAHDRVSSLGVDDVNRDGRLDIVYTFESSGFVSVLYGRAAGGFLQGPDVAVPPGSKHLAIGDLNGDSRPDVAVTVAESSYVEMLFGQEDGSLAPGPIHDAGERAGVIAIGDLNADGIPDLAITNPADSTVSTLLGMGGGNFDVRDSWATPSKATDLALGDLNSDHRVDIAVVGVRSPTISVLIGDGAGAFTQRADYLAGQDELRSVVIRDVNRDGRPDLATGVHSRANVAVLLGQEDGTFGTNRQFEVGQDPVTVVAGDFNRDYLTDLAVTNRIAWTVSIASGLGAGRFSPRKDLATGPWPEAATSGDWNGDGASDLAITHDSGVEVFVSDGAGGFRPGTEYPAGRAPQGITSADVNGDGLVDLLVADPSHGSLLALLGGGDGTFASTRASAIGYLQQGPVVAADFNLDGLADAAIARRAYPGYVTVVLGNGDGTFGRQQDIPTTPGDNPAGMATGDLNSDGRPDLVAANLMGATVTVLLGNGDGTFTRAPTISMTEIKAIGGIGLGDFDNDGICDLVVGSAGCAQILHGNGDGTFTRAGGYGTFSIPISFAVADMNDDCKADIAAVQWGDGRISAVSIFSNRADETPELHATASIRGGDRVIPVGRGSPFLCVEIQPVPDFFPVADVDPRTVVMRSPGTGAVELIHAVSGGGDHGSGDGREDGPGFEACWAREDLALLFSRIQGRWNGTVSIEGCVLGGSRFRAPLELRLLGTGASAGTGVRPNPFNPSATLHYSTSRPGPVRVRVYDLSGRLLATLLDEAFVPAGEHDLSIRVDHVRRGQPASGIYFYRIDTADGTTEGRFAILK